MFTTNLLWQNDDRWAATALGNGPQTVKDWGCLTTSLTMVLNGSGYNETPATVSQKMLAIGAFFGAAINAYRIGEAFPNVALKNLVDCANVPAPLADIDADLAAEKPVLVCVDQSPAAGVQDHWVVLYAKEGSDYLMWDPWRYKGDEPGKKNLLTQRYKNSGSTPAEAITQALFLEIKGKASAAPAAPASPPAHAPAAAPAAPTTPARKTPVPADAMSLTPTTDAIAFRSAPNLGGPLIRRLALNTSLKSLETQSATQAKLGVEGQWLNVQAPEGDQGYVAAWYVRASDGSAPTPKAPAASPSTVKATQDQLAFRSQPVIADNTLIARLPLGTLLIVTDPDAATKLGVNGQWLKVKDSSGREGYVAAWYVG